MTAKGKEGSRKPCSWHVSLSHQEGGRETLDETPTSSTRVEARIYEEITGEKPNVFAVDGSAKTKAHTEETIIVARA